VIGGFNGRTLANATSHRTVQSAARNCIGLPANGFVFKDATVRVAPLHHVPSFTPVDSPSPYVFNGLDFRAGEALHFFMVKIAVRLRFAEPVDWCEPYARAAVSCWRPRTGKRRVHSCSGGGHRQGDPFRSTRTPQTADTAGAQSCQCSSNNTNYSLSARTRSRPGSQASGSSRVTRGRTIPW